MTIDEYLNQPRKLKQRAERLWKKAEALEEAAISPQSAGRFDMPRSRSNDNQTEARLIRYIDAMSEWRDAHDAYVNCRDQLERDLHNLFYWEGLCIHDVYICNAMIDRGDDLTGLEEILNTRNRGAILTKLGEAKQHLRQLLIDQGIEIE